MPPGPTTCVVCGAPLAATGPGAAPVCGQVACQWTYRTAPPDRSCGVCRRPLTLVEVAAGVCAAPACRREWTLERRRARSRAVQEAREARARRERAAFEAIARPLRERGARALGLAAGEYPLAFVPTYTGRTSPLPVRRRRRFEAHLRAMLAASAAPADAGAAATPAFETLPPDAPPFDEPPLRDDLAAVFGHACGVCRGRCCSNAGERAYISPETMRRHRAAHPERSDEEIVAAYLRHVPARTYTGSCVYHTVGGCTLPRDMRAGICNRFYCSGLRDFQAQHGDAEPARAFFVSVGAERGRAAFVDARDVRVVRRAPPPPAPPPSPAPPSPAPPSPAPPTSPATP